MDWIHLAQDRNNTHDVVNNLQNMYKVLPVHAMRSTSSLDICHPAVILLPFTTSEGQSER
jgi:hypothetical protein